MWHSQSMRLYTQQLPFIEICHKTVHQKQLKDVKKLKKRVNGVTANTKSEILPHMWIVITCPMTADSHNETSM